MKHLILLSLYLIPHFLFSQGYSFIFKYFEDNKGTTVAYDEREKRISVDTININNDISQAITFTNKKGKVLGYFNGHQVRNADGTLAINGDSLAWTVSLGWRFIDSLDRARGGDGVVENAIILPTKNDSLFLLFYLDYMFLADIDNFFLPYMLEADEYEFRWYSKALLMSHVHLGLDGRLVVAKENKDIPIIEDFLMYRNLMGVPHANGKDYWIVAPCQHENTAYSVLVSDTSVEVKGKYFFSDNNIKYIWPGLGTSKFSEKGDKLLRYNYRYKKSKVYNVGYTPSILEVVDFDRCTGRVVPGTSNTDLLEIPWFVTAEFSPSAEYIYIGGIYFLARCKTNASTYFDKLDTIYRIPYEGLTINELYNNYDHSECMNRLPSGQIICHSYWQTPYFHLITNPDAKDIKDIGYQSRAITLPEKLGGSGERYKAGGMPRHVHLKTAEINCTTNVDETPYVHNISVYPNPVDHILNIKDLNQFGAEDIQYKIYHLTQGIVVQTGSLLISSIDVSNLNTGFYGIRIKDKIVKFVKM